MLKGLEKGAIRGRKMTSVGSAVMEQIVRVPSDDFFAGIASHPAERLVAKCDCSFDVHAEDCLDDRVQDDLLFGVQFVRHDASGAKAPTLSIGNREHSLNPSPRAPTHRSHCWAFLMFVPHDAADADGHVHEEPGDARRRS